MKLKIKVNGKTKNIVSDTTPIGTIISYMGTIEPKDYLFCNGTVYDIVDYPELCNHFLTNFGKVNYFGGNGTTTFAVPDLRGEFLRGTGANSHTYGGSGEQVGVHQPPTIHEGFRVDYYNQFVVSGNTTYGAQTHNKVYPDVSNINNSIFNSTSSPYIQLNQVTGVEDLAFTSRPTNTSVHYCIKFK